jgi:hypothetical protein
LICAWFSPLSLAVIPRRPIKFEKKSIPGHSKSMMVAAAIPGSRIVGPMYLHERVYQELLQFIDIPMPTQPLVVLGPPKSSKSSVLRELLPRLAAARACEFTPVFVRIEFPLDTTPADAASLLWKQLKRAASAFELEMYHPGPVAEISIQHARLHLPDLIESFAMRLESQKLKLWLLIDECQVRTWTHGS